MSECNTNFYSIDLNEIPVDDDDEMKTKPEPFSYNTDSMVGDERRYWEKHKTLHRYLKPFLEINLQFRNHVKKFKEDEQIRKMQLIKKKLDAVTEILHFHPQNKIISNFDNDIKVLDITEHKMQEWISQCILFQYQPCITISFLVQDKSFIQYSKFLGDMKTEEERHRQEKKKILMEFRNSNPKFKIWRVLCGSNHIFGYYHKEKDALECYQKNFDICKRQNLRVENIEIGSIELSVLDSIQ